MIGKGERDQTSFPAKHEQKLKGFDKDVYVYDREGEGEPDKLSCEI